MILMVKRKYVYIADNIISQIYEERFDFCLFRNRNIIIPIEPTIAPTIIEIILSPRLLIIESLKIGA